MADDADRAIDPMATERDSSGTAAPAVASPGTAAAEAAAAAPPPGGPRSLRTFESLGHRSYRLYLLSMLGQMASLNMQQLVRGFLVFELTGSFAALGTMYLVNSVPGLALSLAGGVLADRVRDKKRVVQAGQLLNGTNALVLGLLVVSGLLRFEHLLIAAVVHGTVMSLMMPARQAMLPEVVGGGLLMNAVALNSAGMNATRTLAPSVAGFLIAVLGAHTVYFIITGLYIYASALLLPVRSEYAATPGEREASETGQRGPRGLSDLVDGFRYVTRDPTMRMLLLVSMLFAVLSMPYQFMLPGWVANVLHEGPDKLGLLGSIAGVGSVTASLVIASLPSRRRGPLLIASGLWLGLALAAFAASSSLAVTAVILLFVGAGDAGRMSLGMVLVQAYARGEYRGRVMSVFMMQRSFATLATFFVGLAATVFGIQAVIGALAVALILLSAGLWSASSGLRALN